MKLLITGSRNFNDKERLKAEMKEAIEKAAKDKNKSYSWIVLHGGAIGADRLAGVIISELNAEGMEISEIVIKPDYDKHGGKVAPLLRNTELVKQCDMVLAAYGKGRDRKGGTWDTVQKSIAAKKRVIELLSNGKKRIYEPMLTLF